jgi:hypothetical protein
MAYGLGKKDDHIRELPRYIRLRKRKSKKKFRPFWTRQAASALTSVLGEYKRVGVSEFGSIGNKSLFLDEIMRVTHASQMKPLVERAKTEGVEG